MLTASEFWQQSQTLYAQPGVAALCLQAQERAGADVNLLLLLALLEAKERHPELAPLLSASRQMADLLIPWRALRRHLKPKLDPADYQSLLTHELALEQLAQRQLLTALAPRSTPAPPGLAAYLHRLGLDDTPLQADLLQLSQLARHLDAPSGKETSC